MTALSCSRCPPFISPACNILSHPQPCPVLPVGLALPGLVQRARGDHVDRHATTAAAPERHGAAVLRCSVSSPASLHARCCICVAWPLRPSVSKLTMLEDMRQLLQRKHIMVWSQLLHASQPMHATFLLDASRSGAALWVHQGTATASLGWLGVGATAKHSKAQQSTAKHSKAGTGHALPGLHCSPVLPGDCVGRHEHRWRLQG